MSNKKVVGAYLDFSRNMVMSVEGLKRFMDIIGKMGYNEVMLYTEDTYEIEGEPEFGYMRGRYSKKELKEIVAYGEKIGVIVVPGIQTLGHFTRLFQWPKYEKIHDCGDILLVEEEATYEFLDKIFKNLRECYNTDKIHLGLDEAGNLGFGRYMHKHGIPKDRTKLFMDHVVKVNEIAKKHGFYDNIMDSDMFFRIVNNGYYYTTDHNLITGEVTKSVPENMSLNYWTYFENPQIYEAMFTNHERFNRKITFMGSPLNWTVFTAQNTRAMDYIEMQIPIALKHNVTDFYFAFFGDDAAESNYFSNLPSLMRFADLCNGISDINVTKKRFFKLFVINFDDFLKIDLPGCVEPGSEHRWTHTDKWQFYADPFLGIQDVLLSKDENEPKFYRSVSRKLSKMSDNPEYGYLFRTAKTYCDVLAYKSVLGKHTRAAYDAKDKEKLREVIKEYKKTEKKLEMFFDEYRNQWLHDAKPFGLEVQDARIGGLIARIKKCRLRLTDYVNGKIQTIEELDEPLLTDIDLSKKTERWAEIITTNRVGLT